MARHRTIDDCTILDAAERVIAEIGAANFTLEAVANQAGISKGSVVRDYGSKQDLVRAIVKRRFNDWRAMLDAAEQAHPVPGAAARIDAHVEVTSAWVPQEQRAAARNLCSSLTNDDELMAIVNEHFEREIAAISAPGAASGALLAFLALEGIRSLELFGGHGWSEDQRRELLDQIAVLARSDLQERLRAIVDNAGGFAAPSA